MAGEMLYILLIMQLEKTFTSGIFLISICYFYLLDSLLFGYDLIK